MTRTHTTTMKAVVKPTATAGAELLDSPIPSIDPTDLLVKVKATSICGTDVHIYKWDSWAQSRIHPPMIFGHEFTGEVVAVGSQVTDFAPGDYISAESHIPCGNCSQCRTDQQHLCARLKIVGVDTNGGFAEYAALPRACAWKNPKSLPLDIASILEPLGNAVYAALVEEVTGRSVVVFGCGPAGLFAVGVARAAGAGKIIAVVKHPFRRPIAEAMGASVVLDAGRGDLVDAIIKETGGSGADVVIEMTGSQEAITQGLAVVTKGGRISAFGIPSGPILVDWARELVFKGARLLGINGRKMFGTWHQMRALLESGRLDPSPVITHRLRLSEIHEGMALMQSRDRRCGKIVMLV